jgi:hypothetical protein
MQVSLWDYRVGSCFGVLVEPRCQRVVRGLIPLQLRAALSRLCEPEASPHTLQPIECLVQRATHLRRRAHSPLKNASRYLAARLAELIGERNDQPAIKESL